MLRWGGLGAAPFGLQALITSPVTVLLPWGSSPLADSGYIDYSGTSLAAVGWQIGAKRSISMPGPKTLKGFSRAAGMIALLVIAACSPRTDVPLLMKLAGEDYVPPADILKQFSPDLQKSLSEPRPAGAATYVVFWKKEFRAPKNEGERRLICSDGSEIAPRPIKYDVEHQTLDGGSKTQYIGAYFWVAQGKKPVTMRIGNARYPVRWATEEEAMRTGGWMDPDTFLK
jgi:hypothetical protein